MWRVDVASTSALAPVGLIASIGAAMAPLRFLKMHGLGNDFVVLDARSETLGVTPALARLLADRREGVGCDQLLVLEPSSSADVGMRVYNPDGSESGACGNGTRCIGRLLMEESGRERSAIATSAGSLEVWRSGDLYTVDMGRPGLGWQDVPLAQPSETLVLDIQAGPLERPSALSMGNPHLVFFVEDVASVPLASLGPDLERHPLFPARTNVGVAEIRDRSTLRLRVFERGAGLTRACGSGACAALVAAARRGLTSRRAEVILDGGSLTIEWADDDRVLMSGPASRTYTGVLAAEVLDRRSL